MDQLLLNSIELFWKDTSKVNMNGTTRSHWIEMLHKMLHKITGKNKMIKLCLISQDKNIQYTNL